MISLITLSEPIRALPSDLWFMPFIPLVVFCVLLMYETCNPRDNIPSKQIKQSYKTNLKMFTTNSLLTTALSSSAFLFLLNPSIGWGILSAIPNFTLKAVLSCFILDIFLYYWHMLCHKLDYLWMFHKVHHNDSNINVSTAFRLHFLELFVTNVFKTILIITAGIDQIVVIFHEILTTLFVLFHHSNISFKGEKYLSQLFITPYLHRTHHSAERIEHDSNYGAVFSIWDRLCGTLLHTNSKTIGIKGYSPQTFLKLLKFGVTAPKLIPIYPVPLDDMIAVAAYYKAEQRGFGQGNDQKDWYEAQQEVLKMAYRSKYQPRNKIFNYFVSIINTIETHTKRIYI